MPGWAHLLLNSLSMLRTIGILFLATIIWWLWPDHGLRHPPGILAPATPAQEMIPPKSLGEFKGYHIEAVATYTLHARVLHTKHYWANGNDLVPYDLALGWGRMSDQAVLDRLDISQANRFFFYQWSGEAPIPPGEIVRSAANTHVISCKLRTHASAVSKLRPGQLVAMKGYLVPNVTGPEWIPLEHASPHSRRPPAPMAHAELFLCRGESSSPMTCRRPTYVQARRVGAGCWRRRSSQRLGSRAEREPAKLHRNKPACRARWKLPRQNSTG